MTSAETLVVIGGGVGGLIAISEVRRLNQEVAITLIEPKDFFEVPWSSVRGLIDAKVSHASTHSLKDWASEHNVKLINSYVTSMDEDNINMANSRTIVDFDLVLVAVGATNPEPGLGRTTPGQGGSIEEGDRLDTMAKRGQELINCGSVAIVGGGLIGIEMAGDLAATAKQREIPLHVHLIHSEPRLAMNEMTAGASAMAQRKLQKLGVTLHLGERCKKMSNNPDDQHDLLLPASNTQVSANEIVWTTGISSHNDFLGVDYKTFETNWLKVDEYFRLLITVKRKGNVNKPSEKYFAFGDCCDWWPNTGMALMENGKTIGHNLTMALYTIAERKAARSGAADEGAAKTKTKSKVKPFKKAKAPPRITVTTIGPKSGVASGIGCCGHTQFILPGMKNKTMFLSNIEKAADLQGL